MQNEEISTLIKEFQNAHSDAAIWDVFNRLCIFLVANNSNDSNNDNTILTSALSLLSDMENKLHDNLYEHYLKAFRFFLTDKKAGYIAEIEKYIQLFIKEYKSFSCEQAFINILDIITYFSKDDTTFNSYIKKLSTVLINNIPKSAFCAYVTYLTKSYKNKTVEIKILKQILELDPDWHVIHIHLGDIYYGQKKWAETIECYESGIMASDMWKNSTTYFNVAWACDKTKQYVKSIEYYQKCLEITPDYKYANNNLGLEYKKIKDYDQALLYFDKSIALGSDGSYPFRNKLETLIKTNRYDEAIALVTEDPTHFATKYYKELLSKASGGHTDMSEVFAGLKKTTENENAGKTVIAAGKSGIELYPHQLEAIQAMDKKILKDLNRPYAGILVLPTGGGKTLTTTYWLMQSILDRGYRIVWIAHRHELLNQAHGSFGRVSYNEISRTKESYKWRIVSGQHDKPVHIKPDDDIIIASKTSLVRGEKYFQNWLTANNSKVFLVIDEAHHAAASEYRKLIEIIKNNTAGFKMLGLTATPFRTADNERGLLKLLFPDDIVYKIDLRELINRGILAEPHFTSVPTNVDMLELFRVNNAEEMLERMANDRFFDINTIGKGITQAIAGNAKRNNAIVGEYVKNKHKYGKTLVFALSVNMAIALNALFNARGVRSEFIVSSVKDIVTGVTISDEDNSVKIRKFRGEELFKKGQKTENGIILSEDEKELDVLVNVNILTEGTDLPKVQSVFLTRPTKSTILMTQMIGRALRGEKAGGTKEAYIVSFIDEWQDKIAWVNPEKLFIDENAIFDESHETQVQAMRLVSIAKIEEFAKIANDTIDPLLSELPFIDRIPVGIYNFKYLIEDESGDEDIERSCDILVYNSMKNAYDEMFEWLPTADLSDTEAAAEHIDSVLFGSLDLLLGYRKQDVVDIINYYKQKRDIPKMIYLTERKDYDITVLAEYILKNPSEKKVYIEKQWNAGDSRWSVFFGLENFKAFRKLVDSTIDRLEYPDEYEKSTSMPITEREKQQIMDLPLYEIRERYPELGKKLYDVVYEKFTDKDGNYFSAKSGFKSKNRLDFQVDHIHPMADGGKSTPDNLQLLTIGENMKKGTKLAN